MVSCCEMYRREAELRKEEERLQEKFREAEERREEKRRAMPSTEEPTGVVELAGHGEEEWVVCTVPLPGGDRVATASGDGKVRVFAVATGALEHELDAHHGTVGRRASSALGGNIIVSGETGDSNVVTWNVASGGRLDEAAAESGLFALVALDGERFVAGTSSGDVVFYTHHGGRGVGEAARIAGAHNNWVRDVAVCGGRLATASEDKTAAVWSVDSRERLATLRGHTNSVWSVDMNDRLVATASCDTTVRIYSAEGDYSCTAVLDWLHTWPVTSVALIGDDHILSSSIDLTICVTQLSSSTVVARTELSCNLLCAAPLADGRLAVCGVDGSPALIDAPTAAADILTAHGTAAFPRFVAAASAPAVAELQSPLQDAVARVAAGELTAAATCRKLISADACYVSLAEWSAGHWLLMRAVRDGGIEGSWNFNNVHNYWFDNLYVPVRKLRLGVEDSVVIKLLLKQAEDAGVIEAVEGTLAAIYA